MQNSNTSINAFKSTFTPILRKTNSKRKIKYCVMDIETEFWTQFRCVGFFDGKNYSYYQSMLEFFQKFLTKEYDGWYCFGHYAAGFDFNFVLKALDQLKEFSYRIIPNNGIGMLIIRKGKDHWVLCDSFKLLPKSLEELTVSFQVEHIKKDDIDPSKIHLYSDKVVGEYNKFDCIGLYEVLQKFEQWFCELNVPLKATLASQAMTTYRKTMKFDIPVLKPEIEKFIRKSYYGGRVEVFKMRAKEKIFMYDVRSLYPYCMKKYSMPIGTPIKVREFKEEKIGFYQCKINMPEVYIPSLPMRVAHKLLFPVGTWRGVYTSKEIEMARLMGAKVYIDYGYVFGREFIFDDYVDKFFAMKESADPVTKQIAKLLLNSLYGKFGQNRDKELIIRSKDVKEIIGCKPYHEEFNLWAKDTRSRSTFIIPSISSWITSCARVELLQWLMKSGEENLFYADTDSIVSTKKLPTGNGLGELKLELEADSAIFLQPKMYILRKDEKLIIKAKGFEKEFVNKLSYENFENALNGNKSAFTQNVMRFAKFKESLKRNNSFVSMVSRKKSIQSFYDKRSVLSNFDTKPLLVEK